MKKLRNLVRLATSRRAVRSTGTRNTATILHKRTCPQCVAAIDTGWRSFASCHDNSWCFCRHDCHHDASGLEHQHPVSRHLPIDLSCSPQTSTTPTDSSSSASATVETLPIQVGNRPVRLSIWGNVSTRGCTHDTCALITRYQGSASRVMMLAVRLCRRVRSCPLTSGTCI